MRRRHLSDNADRQSKGSHEIEGMGGEGQDGNN